jgi:hypothetical protein
MATTVATDMADSAWALEWARDLCREISQGEWIDIADGADGAGYLICRYSSPEDERAAAGRPLRLPNLADRLPVLADFGGGLISSRRRSTGRGDMAGGAIIPYPLAAARANCSERDNTFTLEPRLSRLHALSRRLTAR